MKKRLAAWLVLTIITVVAALCLGMTNEVTKDVIIEQEAIAAENTRKQLVPEAEAFEEIKLPEGSKLDSLFAGQKDGEVVGYVARITATGFGGPVEVTVGQKADGEILGISVGGASFAETAGLGAKAKDKAFMDQFTGKAAPLTVIKAGGVAGDSTIDAITAATITSNAVTSAVNTASNEIAFMMLPAEEQIKPTAQSLYFPDADEFADVTLPAGSALDFCVKANQAGETLGYVAQLTTAEGFKAPVEIAVAMAADGKILGITIGGDSFNETPGYGQKMLEQSFIDQFGGKVAPLQVILEGEAANESTIDAITSATGSTKSVVNVVNQICTEVENIK